MMKRSHRLAGLALGLGAEAATQLITALVSGHPFSPTLWAAQRVEGVSIALTVVVGWVLFFWGTTGPDVDIKLPVFGPHRGITHTDWFWLILIAIGFFVPLVHFYCAGWFTHLVMDELSDAGRVHWFPLGNPKIIQRGGRDIVVKRKWNGFYTVGSPQEEVLLWLVAACGATPVIIWLVKYAPYVLLLLK